MIYTPPVRPLRYVIAITGATGVALGVRILEILSKYDNIETHVVVSRWGIATMKFETDFDMKYIRELADKVYSSSDVSAPISSGSFQHDGMIVVPCSMKTLAAIRSGYTDELITRAADVTIKERRPLLLVTRETPLSSIHLDNMKVLCDMNVIIFPPVMAFYTKPKTIEDVIDQTVGRILDCFGIHLDTFPRWNGLSEPNVVS
ncbi:hypothetical protein CANARDRAFT_193578 [[Candida] arabinofermentans NRRL YB-2248]|uniref:Flavin prenyltransferase PAD1, mitochondrial n=1 Tax=[Candida] arabinofermentans NRRL YB-2248 TaxID=983967 RepID=A0A1E4T8D2_9ASCO|nr:hypothetical protein CANARDRAFT_193578 [[Candida] arabinofermentans NRRL YB-2248]